MYVQNKSDRIQLMQVLNEPWLHPMYEQQKHNVGNSKHNLLVVLTAWQPTKQWLQ